MVLNAIKHFKLITTHKYYVFKNCYKAGLIWRGIKHDLSKYSPTEFLESVRYFSGNRSPIDNCKEVNGWSKAWMHHKGRNTHHYEYWQDNFDKGGEPLQMPYEDALEMVCDYIAAGQAYMKKDFSYSGEYDWWLNKTARGIAMHPKTLQFVDLMLRVMKRDENNGVLAPTRARLLWETVEENRYDNIIHRWSL
jgi:hypothetical protein